MGKKVQQSDISAHYSKVANDVGSNWSSTMLDREIREKEINNIVGIVNHLKSTQDVKHLRLLDIGCGNGYVASRLHCEFSQLQIDGIDSNVDMIDCANLRMLPRTKFYKASSHEISNLPLDPLSYDLVFSTRCFINILDEKERYHSIKLASTYVKTSGFFALMEGFEDGQVAYNLLRSALNYGIIPPSWHNVYLDTQMIENLLDNDFKICDDFYMDHLGLEKHFLSNRYLAMRVLLPLFKNDPDFADKNRNDPTGLALSYLLPKTVGFSPLQLHLWKRK
jgi:SAM-dependent methyltransferase